MKRDVEKTILRGEKILKKNERRDLTISEATIFRNKFMETAKTCGSQEAIWDIMIDVFKFGVAVGANTR